MSNQSFLVDAAVAGAGLVAGCAYGAVLFRAGVRLASRDVLRKARAFTVAGLVFAAANIVYLGARGNAVVEWHIPIWISYYDAAGTWYINLGVVAFFAGAACMIAQRERHRFRWVVACAVALALAGSVACYESVVRPRPCVFTGPRQRRTNRPLGCIPVTMPACARCGSTSTIAWTRACARSTFVALEDGPYVPGAP